MQRSEPVTRFPKRGDIVADLIKRKIVEDAMRPGDRLPSEKQMTELYQVGKASVREALRTLEVQGLIQTSTGPNGGSIIAEVAESRIFNHLQSYFFFKDLTAADVYEIRCTMEPLLASHIAESADQALIDQLAENVAASSSPLETREDWQRHQHIHIQFHELLAVNAKNPMLRLYCQFINRTIRNIARSRESPRQLALIRSNSVWHEKILAAIIARDAALAGQLMHEHIHEIDDTYKNTSVVLQNELHLETQPPQRLHVFKELP